MTSNGTPASDWDVVIVGAGPAGMAAALYTGRAKLKTLLLDRAGMGGGQLMNTELIEDYPAIKSITGSDMAQAFEEQIREFGVEITYGEVVGVEARGNRRVVKIEDGEEYVTKTVIVSTGGMPRKLGVPGEAEFAGPRRELLRHLRRRLLQEPGVVGHRRRRQRRGRSDVPDPLRREGLHHPPPRRVARPEAAPGARAGQPEDRADLEFGARRDRRPGQS